MAVDLLRPSMSSFTGLSGKYKKSLSQLIIASDRLEEIKYDKITVDKKDGKSINRYRFYRNDPGPLVYGGSLSKIIDFINKSKALTKISKWNKRDLSPNRIIDPNGRKRRKPNTSQDTLNTSKKAKL